MEEIEMMVVVAERYNAEDDVHKENVEAKNALGQEVERYCSTKDAADQHLEAEKYDSTKDSPYLRLEGQVE
ncbi:hypothetical protein L195_g063537, partial [Trifolium pratense]